MRLLHRLVVAKHLHKQFRLAGVDLDDYEDDFSRQASFVVVTMCQDDAKWLALGPVADKYCSELHTIETEFAQNELAVASTLCFESKSTTGYPQPVEENRWRTLTYDLTNYCSLCGVGAVQKAPIRLKGEVKWGRRLTTQLNWIPDEVFVPRALWESLFKPAGIDCWPVLTAAEKPIESAVQLKIDQTVELELPPEQPRTRCPSCGRVKFAFKFQGYWPRARSHSFAIAKSLQDFGYEHQAFRGLFVGHDMYMKIASLKLNCHYWACAE